MVSTLLARLMRALRGFHLQIDYASKFTQICAKRSGGCRNIFLWANKTKFNLGQPATSKTISGKVIKVLATNMLPYTTSSNGSNKVGGYVGEMWGILQEGLNFKSAVVSIEHDAGLERLNEGDADIMLAAAVPVRNLSNIENSQPYFYNWYHLYMKEPEGRASSSFYIKTLNPQLWLASFTLFVVMTTSLWLTTKLLNSAYRLEPLLSFPSCSLSIMGGLLNQARDMNLKSYSSRIQITIALLLGFLLSSSFNAVLVSKLAVQHIILPVDSLMEVAEKRLPLCVRTNSYVYNEFMEPPGKTMKHMWRGVVNTPECPDINYQPLLAKVFCSDKLIALENRAVVANFMSQSRLSCKVTHLNTRYFTTGNSFLLLKFFKYKKPISILMTKLRSAGIFHRLEDKWIRKQTTVISHDQSPQVTIFHIKGIIIMYASILMCSILVLAIEIVYKQYLKSKYFEEEITSKSRHVSKKIYIKY